MELVYKIKVIGFDDVSHKKYFYEKWLAVGGVDRLMSEAKKIISGERESNCYSSQPAHGHAPQDMPGWHHVGCLGAWRRGSAHGADCHCLEVFADPQGKYFLVDQSEHGDFRGHDFEAIVIAEIV